MAPLKGLQMAGPCLRLTREAFRVLGSVTVLCVESLGKGDLEGCIFTKLHGRLQGQLRWRTVRGSRCTVSVCTRGRGGGVRGGSGPPTALPHRPPQQQEPKAGKASWRK